jgi:hypothetical protein
VVVADDTVTVVDDTVSVCPAFDVVVILRRARHRASGVAPIIVTSDASAVHNARDIYVFVIIVDNIVAVVFVVIFSSLVVVVVVVVIVVVVVGVTAAASRGKNGTVGSL